MNACDNWSALPEIVVDTIIPVGALVRQLDGGVMAYLDNHGINHQELILAVVDLCLDSEQYIERVAVNIDWTLYSRFTSIAEELEYNGRNIDYETLGVQYCTVVHQLYTRCYAYMVDVFRKKNVYSLDIPVVVNNKSKAWVIAGNLPEDDAIHLHLVITDKHV